MNFKFDHFAMKYLCISILFFTLTIKAQLPKITVVDETTQKDFIKVTKPVNGNIFGANFKNYLIDSINNSFTIINDFDKSAILSVFNKENFFFIIEPGKSYTIIFDLNNKLQPFKFIGQNEQGQYLFHQLKHKNFDDKADSYTAKEINWDTIKTNVQKDADSELQQYKALFTSKQIDYSFYNFIKLDIEYYYATVLSTVINWNRKPTFVADWANIFKDHDLTNIEAMKTTHFANYIESYATGYHGYLRRQEGFNKVFNTKISNEYLVDWYQQLDKNTTINTNEYALASMLYGRMILKKYEQELADLFKLFIAKYPKSNYLPFLKPFNDEIIKFHNISKLASAKEEKIIPNYLKINTLEELISKFIGKTVFVDLWATWCSPCKEEFAFNNDLKFFLKSKNVEILYISMDEDSRDQQWKDMIKYYQLTGNHIRTSNVLRKDIAQKIWGTQTYSIPRYLILKDGKIVESEALRPSSKQDLYNQIAKYLM